MFLLDSVSIIFSVCGRDNRDTKIWYKVESKQKKN